MSIRRELGFESAKAFYRHLESKRALEFNYAHYMRIEGAKALPSPSMISSIGGALEPRQADRLTLAYCQSIFPSQQHLFKNTAARAAAAAKPAESPAPAPEDATGSPTLIRQRYLTEAQVAALCRSSLHYSLFLILTLARGSVERDRLTGLLKAEASALDSAVKDLIRARLASDEGGRLGSISKEMRFPKAESASVRKHYEQIDRWNFDFDRRMGFESLQQKMMIRRVSARYLGVIQAHCGVLLDLIRAAEEINPELNDDVLMLNLNISRGRLPG